MTLLFNNVFYDATPSLLRRESLGRLVGPSLGRFGFIHLFRARYLIRRGGAPSGAPAQ